MRQTRDPDGPRLCNSCEVRENLRNPKGKKMETIGILIQCPKDEHIVIEELCINRGIDLTRYFMELHHGSQDAIATLKEMKEDEELANKNMLRDQKEHREKGGKWEDEEEPSINKLKSKDKKK
jgi:hypothetical protein